MPLTLEKKKDVVTKYQVHKNDTGSPEVQVAIWTEWINELTEHFKRHPKDNNSRRGLLVIIGKRSALLKYLSKQNPDRYQKLIKQLGIRK
ncbi:MAG: 30S ribosomal protein S15 [Planctomycetota bacterium]